MNSTCRMDECVREIVVECPTRATWRHPPCAGGHIVYVDSPSDGHKRLDRRCRSQKASCVALTYKDEHEGGSLERRNLVREALETVLVARPRVGPGMGVDPQASPKTEPGGLRVEPGFFEGRSLHGWRNRRRRGNGSTGNGGRSGWTDKSRPHPQTGWGGTLPMLMSTS